MNIRTQIDLRNKMQGAYDILNSLVQDNAPMYMLALYRTARNNVSAAMVELDREIEKKVK